VWRDSRTLFSHAVAVNDADYLSHLNLGQGVRGPRVAWPRRCRTCTAPRRCTQRRSTWSISPTCCASWSATSRPSPAYREAVRLQPEFPSARNNLGNSLVAVGDWAGAEEQFVIAVRQDPAYPDAHCNLGLVRLRQGRADEAAACFRRALELEPGHARAAALLARLPQPTGMK
jgi:tetratricopeptide (TPR) repeat protein